MVRRSALNRLQISDETSSMISSILEVAWILLVTFCRFFENINLALTSADAVAAAGGVFRTALIVTSSIDPRSRRLQLQRHISYYTTKSGPRFAGLRATRRGESPAGLAARRPGRFLPSWQPVPAPKPAFEQIDVVAALRQQEGGGGTAPAALAIDDIFLVYVQGAESVADFGQRNIDRSGQLVVLIFGHVAHVYPLGAAQQLLLGLLHVDPAQQRFAQQRVEILLAQAQQSAVRLHGDGGVALGLGHQRLFAEGIAALERRQRHVDPAYHALHLAPAGLDQVVVVALRSLADDYLAFFRLDALEAPQQLVDVRRGQLGKGAEAQVVDAEQPRHDIPVGAAGRPLGGRLRRTDLLLRGHLIPGEHDVEQVVVDAYQP